MLCKQNISYLPGKTDPAGVMHVLTLLRVTYSYFNPSPLALFM